MRFLNSWYLALALFMAGSILSLACLQHYTTKPAITISCEDPVDEDGSNEFEDDKEHITHIITYLNPIASQVKGHSYREVHCSHALEIIVPPPEI
jgi:hypothetical protein